MKELTFDDIEVGDFVEHTGADNRYWTNGKHYEVFGKKKKNSNSIFNKLLLKTDIDYSEDWYCFTDFKIHKKIHPKPLFKGMKFRVNSLEHSLQIQEYLLSLGYMWSSDDKCTKPKLNKKFLFTSEEGYIGIDDVEEYFNQSDKKEYVLKATSYYLEEVVAPVEMITIDGKEYEKAKVLKALENI